MTLPGKPDVTYQFMHKLLAIGHVHQLSKIRVIITHNSYMAYGSYEKTVSKNIAYLLVQKGKVYSLTQLTDCTSYQILLTDS